MRLPIELTNWLCGDCRMSGLPIKAREGWRSSEEADCTRSRIHNHIELCHVECIKK